MSQEHLEEFVPESLRPLRSPPVRTDYTMTKEQFEAFTRQRRADLMGAKRVPSKGIGELFCELFAAAIYALLFITVAWFVAAQGGGGAFVVWVSCVIVGAVVGEMKGDAKGGAIWAAFLGPLGLIIVLVMPNKYKVAAAAEQAAQQARLVQLQEAQLKELKELRSRLGTEKP